MNHIRTIATLTVAALSLSLTCQGAVTITASEIGDDVVFSAAGTLDLSDLTLEIGEGTALAGFRDDEAPPIIRMSSGTSIVAYTGGVLAPSGFSDAMGFIQPTSSTGAVVGSSGWSSETGIQVDSTYVSGESLTSTMTYANATLDSLQLNAGSYTWTWGSGANADSMTLNVVPEPSPGLLSILAISMAILPRRRNRQPNPVAP